MPNTQKTSAHQLPIEQRMRLWVSRVLILVLVGFVPTGCMSIYAIQRILDKPAILWTADLPVMIELIAFPLLFGLLLAAIRWDLAQVRRNAKLPWWRGIQALYLGIFLLMGCTMLIALDTILPNW